MGEKKGSSGASGRVGIGEFDLRRESASGANRVPALGNGSIYQATGHKYVSSSQRGTYRGQSRSQYHKSLVATTKPLDNYKKMSAHTAHASATRDTQRKYQKKTR